VEKNSEIPQVGRNGIKNTTKEGYTFLGLCMRKDFLTRIKKKEKPGLFLGSRRRHALGKI